MIRDVYLYGAPGGAFGRRFRLDVSSPAEAIRALVCLRPRLRETFRAGAWRIIVGKPRIRNGVNVDAFGMRLGAQPLHIVPATPPAGGGRSGKSVGLIIIGVVVMAAAIYFSGGLAAAALPEFGAAMSAPIAGGALLGMTYGGVALMGVSLIAAGVSGLLIADTPLEASSAATDRAPSGDQPSYIFNGVTNNSQPGGPVPLVIGTHLVGSVVVSAGLQVEDVAA